MVHGGAVKRSGWKVLLAVTALAASLVGWSPAASALSNGSFSLQPVSPANVAAPRSSFRYQLSPGQRVQDSVVLSNLSDQPRTFDIWAGDAYNVSNGDAVAIRPKGWASRGVGSWITLPTGTYTVPAKTAATFTFTLAVPQDATPGDHVGGIEALDVTADRTTTSSRVTVRQGVADAVFVRVGGVLHAAASVGSIVVKDKVSPFGPLGGTTTAAVSFRVANSGNTVLSGTARVAVTDVMGRTVKVYRTVDVRSLMPGNHVDVTEPTWRPLPILGPEHVVVTFQANGMRSARAAKTFWIMPWAWLLLVVALLAAVGWLWRFLRRVRKVVHAVERAGGRGEAPPDLTPVGVPGAGMAGGRHGGQGGVRREAVHAAGLGGGARRAKQSDEGTWSSLRPKPPNAGG